MSDPIDQEIRILRAIFWSERDPEGRAFVPLADAYLRKGSPDEAISLLEDGLGRHPDFASAHMVAARAYRAVGARGAVQRALGSVLELDPGNASALRMKGELAESEGNGPVALTAFREAVARNPEYEDLPGRIERLALGMAAVEPSRSSRGIDRVALDASVDDPLDSLDTSDAAFDAFDAPDRDFDAPGAAPDDPDGAIAERMVFPQDEVAALTRDVPVADDLAGDGIERGSGLRFSGAGVTGAGVDDLDIEDAREESLEPVESDFGIDDFPSAGRDRPADSVGPGAEGLVPDRLELEPGPRPDAREDSKEGRVGDLEAHEALLAERGPDHSDEAGATGGPEDPPSGDADIIDPFGFDAAPRAAGSPATPALEEGAANVSADAPSDLSEDPDDPDDDSPAWTLSSSAGTPRKVPAAEPLPVTRTLGELYARQGLISQAAGVFQTLLERNPDDESLRARLTELTAEASGGSPAPAPDIRDTTVAGGTGEGESSAAASSPSSPEREIVTGTTVFSAADRPIGAWFGDLLAWSPGAVPVAHLAPGAVPIESLAPAGWVAEHSPGAEPATLAESEVAPEPDAPSAREPAPEPEAFETAVGTTSASADVPSTTSREDGFEGLDDFQDWLRSLNR